MLKLLLNIRCCFLVMIILIVHTSANAQLTYDQLTVQFDSPWTYKKLQLIPVRFKDIGKDGGNANIKLLDGNVVSFGEAMNKRKIIVKEVSDGGADVLTLMIKNRSNDNIMLMSGEMVQGGKQDRAFGETTIIPKNKKKNYVQVFCVETVRWDDYRCKLLNMQALPMPVYAGR